jgi:hypothetical protein
MHIAAQISLVAAGLMLLVSPVIVVAIQRELNEPGTIGHLEAPSAAESQEATQQEPAQNWVFRFTADGIEDGMAYERVLELVRWPGVDVSSSQSGESSTRIVKWTNPDRSFLVCAFMDGKLISKHQFMLP